MKKSFVLTLLAVAILFGLSTNALGQGDSKREKVPLSPNCINKIQELEKNVAELKAELRAQHEQVRSQRITIGHLEQELRKYKPGSNDLVPETLKE